MPSLDLDPNWTVVLRHKPTTYLPWELLPYRDRLRFCRWMVLVGRLSDFALDREADGRLVGASAARGDTTAGSGR